MDDRVWEWVHGWTKVVISRNEASGTCWLGAKIPRAAVLHSTLLNKYHHSCFVATASVVGAAELYQ